MATGGVKAAPFFSFLCELIILKCSTVMAPCDPFLPSVVSFGKEAHTRKSSFHLHVCFSFFSFHSLQTATMQVALQANLTKNMRFQKCRNFGKMQSWWKTETC